MLIIGFHQKADRAGIETEKACFKRDKHESVNVFAYEIGEFDNDTLFIVDGHWESIIAAIELGMELDFEPIARRSEYNPYREMDTRQAMDRNTDNHYYYYWVHNGEYLSELELDEIYKGSA